MEVVAVEEVKSCGSVDGEDDRGGEAEVAMFNTTAPGGNSHVVSFVAVL